MHTVIKQRFPKVGNALPLRYRICRNQRRANRCSLHNIGSLFIPATDIIQVSGVFPPGENGIYIGFLLFAHKPRPNKRRIPHNIIQLTFGNHALPIHPQGVALYNKGVCFQRQKFKRNGDNLFSLFHHLTFSNPKCCLSNCYGKIIYFNAIELTDRNLNTDRLSVHTTHSGLSKTYFSFF